MRCSQASLTRKPPEISVANSGNSGSRLETCRRDPLFGFRRRCRTNVAAAGRHTRRTSGRDAGLSSGADASADNGFAIARAIRAESLPSSVRRGRATEAASRVARGSRDQMVARDELAGRRATARMAAGSKSWLSVVSTRVVTAGLPFKWRVCRTVGLADDTAAGRDDRIARRQKLRESVFDGALTYCRPDGTE
jgi:hypothetical protein